MDRSDFPNDFPDDLVDDLYRHFETGEGYVSYFQDGETRYGTVNESIGEAPMICPEATYTTGPKLSSFNSVDISVHGLSNQKTTPGL